MWANNFSPGKILINIGPYICPMYLPGTHLDIPHKDLAVDKSTPRSIPTAKYIRQTTKITKTSHFWCILQYTIFQLIPP